MRVVSGDIYSQDFKVEFAIEEEFGKNDDAYVEGIAQHILYSFQAHMQDDEL